MTTISEEEKQSIIFARLVFTFQAAAMQQMGKQADPFTGKIQRDLQQAAMSIDTLDMLRVKCRGNLNESEQRFLDHILSELKLNYVDEIGRPDPAPEDGSNAEPASASPES
jgi:hypothetical protein